MLINGTTMRIKIRYHNRQCFSNTLHDISSFSLCVNQTHKKVCYYPLTTNRLLCAGNSASRSRRRLMKSNVRWLEKVSYFTLTDISHAYRLFYTYTHLSLTNIKSYETCIFLRNRIVSIKFDHMEKNIKTIRFNTSI